MVSKSNQGNTVTLAVTAVVIGAAALIGAMLALDVDDWQRFAAYFVLIPLGNICLAIAIWLGINELRDR